MSQLPSTLPEGIALLVAGWEGPGEARAASSSVQTLGQIGEALMATGAPWRIRRLSAGAGERYAPDRANLKRFIDELARPADVAILVAAAEIATTPDGPAIVTGGQHDEYPSEATLPLDWVRARLRAVSAERLLLVLSAVDAARQDRNGQGARERAAAWLDALATGRPHDVIAVEASGGRARTFDALLAGLCGEALDPRTGTVTMRSIAEHLERAVPGIAMQPSLASETLAVSPPLGGLWTVRASEVQRARTRVPADEPNDLTGAILPGRFRIEELLARGSFGTVYRARQLSVQRHVAVKVLHAGIDPASEDGRLFVHEIQSVGRIDHTNVVRIHQADITPAGRLFFAMELLVGRDLQEIATEQGKLPLDRAVALTRQLLAGLGAAHEAGLVHADVKPANAFVVAGKEGERVVLLDFGLARLRPPGRPAESAGGTPAYMAPEQLRDGRVDARSDLFAAALVLVTLLTGWRRRSAEELVPPLDGIEGAGVRAALARALAIDPAERFQSAADFADALAGRAPGSSQVGPPPASRGPFRRLAPFTEGDRGRLHGREREIAELTEYVLYRRAVVYTAPSGAGKTSLLRAGLIPHLEALGARPVYLACRPGAAAALAAAIRPGAATIERAIAAWRAAHGGKLVLVLDQLEAVLTDEPAGDGAPADLIGEVLAFGRLSADADVSVVLSVREDFLARVVGVNRRLDEGIPILRLGPLDRAGARAAIAGPLAEHRLAIEPELLDALLADLETAARAIAPEMGWGAGAAAYPPHLQLACSVLYEALGPGEATLTVEHYRRLGGFDAIVGEHLDRVLDSELDREDAAVARDLFLTLVTSSNTRALRSEAELLDIVGHRHGAERVAAVLDALRERGLLVRLRAAGGEPSWELVHDSLVPRVLAWIDRRDLDRRRAVELLRHHLRRSRPDAPSLLGRAELRELRAHADAVAELDGEWARREGAGPWTPSALVERSRRVRRRRDLSLGLALAAILFTLGVSLQRCAAERRLRDRDMGRFTLELAPFDWDERASAPAAAPVDSLAGLRWRIHDVGRADPRDPGEPLPDFLVVRGDPVLAESRLTVSEPIEARGGDAFLVVERRGRDGETCRPSVIPLRHLPGYAQRNRAAPRLRVRVPTCRATRHGMVDVPAGLYVFGGVGDSASRRDDLWLERIAYLDAFSIDRTEVTNAAFGLFAEMAKVTEIALPKRPDVVGLRDAAGLEHPVAGINWSEARAYCRFMGKDLPSAQQWTKAMRGGLFLADGSRNPLPRRNFPWGPWKIPAPARLHDSDDVRGPAEVGSYPEDRSPYGVMDMAGNVQEWTLTVPQSADAFRVTRGGYWDEESTSAELDGFTANENMRPEAMRGFALGMRCVLPGT